MERLLKILILISILFSFSLSLCYLVVDYTTLIYATGGTLISVTDNLQAIYISPLTGVENNSYIVPSDNYISVVIPISNPKYIYTTSSGVTYVAESEYDISVCFNPCSLIELRSDKCVNLGDIDPGYIRTASFLLYTNKEGVCNNLILIKRNNDTVKTLVLPLTIYKPLVIEVKSDNKIYSDWSFIKIGLKSNKDVKDCILRIIPNNYANLVKSTELYIGDLYKDEYKYVNIELTNEKNLYDLDQITFNLLFTCKGNEGIYDSYNTTLTLSVVKSKKFVYSYTKNKYLYIGRENTLEINTESNKKLKYMCIKILKNDIFKSENDLEKCIYGDYKRFEFKIPVIIKEDLEEGYYEIRYELEYEDFNDKLYYQKGSFSVYLTTYDKITVFLDKLEKENNIYKISLKLVNPSKSEKKNVILIINQSSSYSTLKNKYYIGNIVREDYETVEIELVPKVRKFFLKLTICEGPKCYDDSILVEIRNAQLISKNILYIITCLIIVLVIFLLYIRRKSFNKLIKKIL